MEEKVKQAIDVLLKYVTQGAEFVKEQAPLVAQEYLRYHLIECIVYVVVAVVVIGVAWVMYGRGRKHFQKWSAASTIYGLSQYGTPERAKASEECNTQGCAATAYLVPTGIAFIVAIIMLIANTLEIVHITVAPRLYVLEGLRKLL